MELNTVKYALSCSIIDKIEDVTNTESSKQVVDGLRNSSKQIYDHLYKQNILLQLQSKALRKLLIDGFDSEQIFQQIELQNKSALEHFNKSVSSVDDKYTGSLNSNSHTELRDDDDDGDKELKVQAYTKDDLSEHKEYVFDDDSDSSVDGFSTFKPSDKDGNNLVDDLDLSDDDDEAGDFLEKLHQSQEDEEIDAEDEEIDAEDEDFQSIKKSTKEKIREKPRKKFHSVVDDQFFKLSNLSEFLRVEDIKAQNEGGENEEDIDYFEDIPSDDFDESNDEITGDGSKSFKNIMYEDFFDPPESGDENIQDEKEISDEEGDQSDFDEGDEEEDVDNNEDEKIQENDSSIVSKTPFEIEQEKIKKTISDFEDMMIQKPEWHLTGEVAASNRPKDSLLHQDTDYDSSAKPVLVEDDDLLKKTEKAIISIIKNKAFNDGVRMVKPVNDVASLKKEITVDSNKSKKSLAQVYEEDYLKKKYGEEEQENPKHVEIKKMMDSLLPELQTLFCHIPKPAIPDIKIVSNLPAITVEEVAPTSISDVTLLAPEEIKKKTGTLKGQSERSDSDRKRERRKKKMFQRMKFKKLETEASQNPLSAEARKLDKINTLKKLKQNRNTKILEAGEEKIKSSKDFFSRLQDSVNSGSKPSEPKRKRIK